MSAISRDPNDVASKPTNSPDLDLIGHATACVAATRSFLLACLFIFVMHDGVTGEHPYPAYGPAKQFAWGWMWPIFLRNAVGALLICGSWDYFLYFSPLSPKLWKYKLNQKRPTIEQFKHDAFYTMVGTVAAGILECGMCHVWATDVIRCPTQLFDGGWQNTLYQVAWALTVTHWRIPHFWAIHRGMHPWFRKDEKRMIPDVGRFMYKHVHSLHHKSYNPTAFSGTSMHPIEAFMYYSAALIAVPFGTHPVVFLACVVDSAVGAWLGHDGFQWPGSGDYFHQLHHTHFECNYGAMHVPIDKWLGTYADKPIPELKQKAT